MYLHFIQNYIQSLQRWMSWYHHMLWSTTLCLELHSEQLIDSRFNPSCWEKKITHTGEVKVQHNVSVNHFVSIPLFHPSPRNTFWTRKSWRWSSENPDMIKHGHSTTPVPLRVRPAADGTTPKRSRASQLCLSSTLCRNHLRCVASMPQSLLFLLKKAQTFCHFL